MQLKFNPRHRHYDDPLTEIAHIRSTVDARLGEDRERRMVQREQEVRLILNETQKVLKAISFLDHIISVIVGAVLLGLAIISWLVWK